MKFYLLIILLLVSGMVNAQNNFKPGEIWKDQNGKAINAHGGCVINNNGTYYWFGENRTGGKSNGISCYRSTNLYNWERLGLALTLSGLPQADLNDLAQGRKLERPKVIFNKTTKKWVMWAHWEKENGYEAARVVVATSDKVEGPYQLYKTFRPNDHDSRDMTLFEDHDGTAYHFSATDMNKSINVIRLRPDYLEGSPTENKILIGERAEAPAIFKVGDVYFGLFSGSTGWDPNPGRSAYSWNILGNWSIGSNFAVDQMKELTYQSQSAYVFKVGGKENAFVYYGDRWDAKDLGASRYVWLPISMRSGYPTVTWHQSWDLSIFNAMYRYKRAKAIIGNNNYSLLEKQSNRLVSKPANGFSIADDDDNINLSFQFLPTANPSVFKLKDLKSGKYLESVFNTLRLNEVNVKGSQEWEFYPQNDGYFKIRNKADGKYLTVSGGATFSGSGLYLNDADDTIPQNFAVYFDSAKYQYEVADIFSAAYHAECIKQAAQSKLQH
ncbi:glycosyl hydrolase family 43 [Sphingobacteriaceae bacterium GW460-11-11-14-LB5]|nr:glycosyl hydrolase family 43 [Sphingobacteriaceae bacterium GW460-11-11-14-LB5]